MAEVKILKEGYSKDVGVNKVKAEGTSTLVKSTKNIIIDTGNVGSASFILQKLKQESLTPKDIHFVVNTHGDLDHIGNNSLFQNATFIGFGSVCKGDAFTFFAGEFVIDKDVKVFKNPGHSSMDVSVCVKTKEGVIVIAGDIFENERDYDGKEAKTWSYDWKLQFKNRKKILALADYIIPGHGKMFQVKTRNKIS